MDTSIIGLVVFVVVVLIIYKVTKEIAKTMFLASAIFVVLFIVVGFFVLSDAKDFRENFSSKDSLYLLEDDGVILAGLSGNFAEESSPFLLSDSELSSINEAYSFGDFDSVKGDNYKLFIIPLSSFDDVEVDDVSNIRQLLMSDSPVDDYVVFQLPDASDSQREFARKQVLDQSNVFDDSGFRSLLFGMLLSKSLDDNGSVFLFQGFKEGSIVIFPVTPLLKLLSWVPSSLFGSMVGV